MTASTRELILDDIKKVCERLEEVERELVVCEHRGDLLRREVINLRILLLNDALVLMEETEGNESEMETGYMTMDGAREALERNKDATGYFSGQVRATDMAMMLREMGFGVPETNTIIAALVLVGAKFPVG